MANVRILALSILMITTSASRLSHAASPKPYPAQLISRLNLDPGLLRYLKQIDVRTLREASLLTYAELKPRGIRRTAVSHLGEALRGIGLELGKSPFVFLPIAARLTLARRGVWTAAGLAKVGWTPESDWLEVESADHSARLEAMSTNPHAFMHAAPETPDDVQLDNVEITVRLSNILRAAGVTTTRQLSILTELEFASFPKVDLRAKNDLKDLLAQTGIFLGRGDLGKIAWADRLTLARAGVWSKDDIRLGQFDPSRLAELSKKTRAEIEKIRCDRTLAP